MGEMIGRCPHCGKTLKVPDDVTKFLCMYCGTGLTPEALKEESTEKAAVDTEAAGKKLKEALAAGDPAIDRMIAEALDLDEYDPVANEVFLLRHISEMILQNEDLMSNFTRSGYEPAFRKYAVSCRYIVQTADRVAVLYGDRGQEKLKEAALYLVDAIDARIAGDASLRAKRAKADKKEDLKMIYAIYTVPMVQEQKVEAGDAFADVLVDAWNERNPKNQIGKGNYADIQAGFRKGKLCFITTAVCDSFGKPDDCYELTSFRHFRDTYMQQEEELSALCEEYYEIAPGIVTCIDLSENKEEIYKGIWEKWLSPCLSHLENQEPELCADTYKDMVLTLKKRYLS